MSDCLFNAFQTALLDLEHRDRRFFRARPEESRKRDRRRYQSIKNRWQANPSGYTEIALAPHIVRLLAAQYGLVVYIQHRLYTVEQARQVCWQERNVKTWLASFRWPNWGQYVEELTLPNAIYLQVSPAQHAYFRREPVSVGHFMALQVMRRS